MQAQPHSLILSIPQQDVVVRYALLQSVYSTCLGETHWDAAASRSVASVRVVEANGQSDLFTGIHGDWVFSQMQSRRGRDFCKVYS